MIVQAIMNALDPVYRVGDQIVEALETSPTGGHALCAKDADHARHARLIGHLSDVTTPPLSDATGPAVMYTGNMETQVFHNRED